jgi:hypothetical protein
MEAHSLMRQLMEIERVLPTRDDCAIRNLILAAQDGVLQLERENEELALENAGLRLRLRERRGASVPLVAQSLNADAENASQARDFSADTRARAGRCAGDDSPGSDHLAGTGTWRTTHFFFS